MNENSSKHNSRDQLNGLNFCPHLGLQEDQSTFLAYPSKWNFCHKVSPIAVPKLEHQNKKCLNASHKECAVYLSPSESKMPRNLSHQGKNSRRISSYAIRILAAVSIIGVLVFLFTYRDQITTEISHLVMPPWQKTQLVTTPATATETPMKTASQITITPTQSATTTPSPTMTPTRPAPVLQLEMPIGDEFKFVIHRVLPGETLERYTRDYNTTIESIRASNVALSQVLWVDRLIVVPIDNENVTGQIAFEPYQVKVRAISVENLADELQVNVDLLIFYNNLWPGYILERNDWLLLPFENIQP